MEENYLPLFRKYRPQSFKDVVGQESLVKALSNAIELNRIANAYLFCGPRGTGKTSCARIFAKSLNCEHGPTLEPCQKCASCVDITNATGLDVIEIDAASNRGIQDAKELISQTRYAPINGKYKIFIIDEVHMLSNDAFNALLKTFEEPPENVIFILATTEPHKVLETIVSRCQRFDLRRITTEDIIKRLREISDLENIKITDDALFAIAKNVSGGLRDSLALLDQVSILGVKEEITKDLIEELLGKINFDVLLNLLKNIYSKDINASINAVDEIYSKGNEPRNLAENFIEFLRNILLVLDGKDDESIKKLTCLIDEDIQRVRAFNFDKNKIMTILNTMIEYYKEIKISTNPYLWMELGAIASISADNIKNIKIPNQNIKMEAPCAKDAEQKIQKPEKINNLQEKEQKPLENEAVSKINQDENMPKTQIADTVDEASVWSGVISKIGSLSAKAFYSSVAKLVCAKDKKITLGFLYDNVLLQAKSDSKIQHLKEAIKLTYPDWDVEFIKINQSTPTIEVKFKPAPKRPPEVPPQNIQNPIEREQKEEQNIQNKEKRQYSPKVQEMIEEFNGRIIE